MDGQVDQKLFSQSFGDLHCCKEREKMLLFFLPQRLSREKRAHVITVCTSLSLFFVSSGPRRCLLLEHIYPALSEVGHVRGERGRNATKEVKN